MINKKGSMMLVILFAVIYFMAGMIIYQLIKPDITQTRIDLSCASPADSADMVNCLVVDGIVPMIIIGVLSSAGAYITDRSLR